MMRRNFLAAAAARAEHVKTGGLKTTVAGPIIDKRYAVPLPQQ
jgi:hypothetical protein